MRYLGIPADVMAHMHQRAAAMLANGTATQVEQLARVLAETWVEGHAAALPGGGRELHAGRPMPERVWLAQRSGLLGPHVYTTRQEAERMTEGSEWEPTGPYVLRSPVE